MIWQTFCRWRLYVLNDNQNNAGYRIHSKNIIMHKCQNMSTKLASVRQNSITADVNPILDVQAIYGHICNAEYKTSKIRILIYIQTTPKLHSQDGMCVYLQ